MALRVQLCQSILYSFLNQNPVSSSHLLLLWASQWASLPLSRGNPSLCLQLSSKQHPANLLLIIGGAEIFLGHWTCFPGANVYLPCLPSILSSIKSNPWSLGPHLSSSPSALVLRPVPLIPPWTVFSRIALLALSPPPPRLCLQLLVLRNTVSETTFLSLTSSSFRSLLLRAWSAFLVFRTCQLLAFPNSVMFKWEFSPGGVQLLSAELCSKPSCGKALRVSLGLRFHLERFWNAWFKGVMRWNTAWEDWCRVVGCLLVNRMFV